jgi:hypothetical protein
MENKNVSVKEESKVKDLFDKSRSSILNVYNASTKMVEKIAEEIENLDRSICMYEDGLHNYLRKIKFDIKYFVEQIKYDGYVREYFVTSDYQIIEL